jgi:hypothetical protein
MITVVANNGRQFTRDRSFFVKAPLTSMAEAAEAEDVFLGNWASSKNKELTQGVPEVRVGSSSSPRAESRYPGRDRKKTRFYQSGDVN